MQEIAKGIVASTEFRHITVGAVATGSGIVCVDVPPLPSEARQWRAMLQDHFKQPIRLLVLTDAHPHRLLGSHWIKEARIVAHSATFDLMRGLPNNFVDQTADLIARDSEERSSFAGVRLHYPCVTFNERMTVFVKKVPITLHAMPGPTPGNVWLHFPNQGVVFTGDSVVVDQPPMMFHTRSKDWLNSLSVLRRPRFAADVIVPGRGPLTDKAATQPISEFLRYVRRRMQRFYLSGRPRVEVGDIVPSVMAHLGNIDPAEEEAFARWLRGGLESVYDEFEQGSDQADSASGRQ
ncbi:MBL fold metallo-hydrolase [Chloroflexota bacterium]